MMEEDGEHKICLKDVTSALDVEFSSIPGPPHLQ